MRIIVFGAAGRSGRMIVQEAVDRGIETIAAVRDIGRDRPVIDPRAHIEKLDASDTAAVARAATGCTHAINATRSPGSIEPDHLVGLHRGLTLGLHKAAVEHLTIVGGAGSLPCQGEPFYAHPAFPSQALPRGVAHFHLLQHLKREEQLLRWLYLVPPPSFSADGPRTARYRLVPPTLESAAARHYAISYKDYALALIDALSTDPRLSGPHLVTGW
ncbi:MAG: NAD(P)H-binding protein [Nocardiopsaceae bacterium]|nr:NAD(P)H-binding protein [Nocardiopsaceae bacterium]